jgi:hypothetical protein
VFGRGADVLFCLRYVNYIDMVTTFCKLNHGIDKFIVKRPKVDPATNSVENSIFLRNL